MYVGDLPRGLTRLWIVAKTVVGGAWPPGLTELYVKASFGIEEARRFEVPARAVVFFDAPVRRPLATKPARKPSLAM